jgi:hypothetical protein
MQSLSVMVCSGFASSLIPVALIIGYGAFTTAELKVLTEDQRAQIKATGIREDAKPLQTITLKDCILIECN